MKTFFGRWWLPVIVHAMVLAYFYVTEYYAEPASANDINLGGAAIILLSSLILLVSCVYQFVTKNLIAGIITAAVLFGTVSYLFT